MTQICFYFQVHQPERLARLSYFDLYHKKSLFDDTLNKAVMEKVAVKCYLPMNRLLCELIHRYGNAFKVSFSISGIFLEQAQKYTPEVIESFQKLAETGSVEFIAETYYHSLASVFSKEEFKAQVKLQTQIINKLFDYTPRVFRNTELIYRNDIAEIAANMGFKGMLLEGIDKMLDWRSPYFVYHAKGLPEFSLLLKSYQLSDDIAYRFSDKNWQNYPLFADTYTHWLKRIPEDSHCINLFMDYETFGEHHWHDSGIFKFFTALPKYVLESPRFTFNTVSETIDTFSPADVIDAPDYISWADSERDLSAWLGNPIQNSLFKAVNRLEHEVKSCRDPDLLHIWRKLTTSDHYYYLCLKGSNDGNVHDYFSPFESPNSAFNHAINALKELKHRITLAKERHTNGKKHAVFI